MIVTIDGPAGSGKSTVARELAARLHVPYLDTGAMYRAVAHVALERGVDIGDGEALADLARSLRIELDCGARQTRVRVDGRDVSEAIRTMAVSEVTSPVAAHPGVRQVLVEQQVRIGKDLGSFVTEGRDQGAVVFPDAEHKFLLDASVEERAARRLRDHASDGEEVSLEAVTENICARDRTDAGQWEPLLSSGEVTVVDTTQMTVEEVVDRILEHLRSHPSA